MPELLFIKVLHPPVRFVRATEVRQQSSCWNLTGILL